MLDRDRVAESVAGCDALLHAAAMVSLDSKQGEQVYQTNIQGLESVIGSAIEAGIGNIVYVSSFTVLFQPGARLITESTPLCKFRNAYARSKRDCEIWVRNRQAAGAPIQISYPSGVYGPDDPKLSESNRALVSFVKSTMLDTSSGTMCVDVRDIASMHRWLLENPPMGDFENHRYIMGGHYYSWREFHGLLQEISGREIPAPSVPGWLLRSAGRVLDAIRRVYPIASPLSSEAMAIMTQCAPVSSEKLIRASGLQFRPAEETLRDTLEWLLEAGYLKARHVNFTAAAGQCVTTDINP
jgi:nucleoside-diphosphate-sugar epimerase